MTAAVAGTPGARPSSSTASRVTAAVIRCGPAVDLDQGHHAVHLDRADHAREAVARGEARRPRGGARGARRGARPRGADTRLRLAWSREVRSLPVALPAPQGVRADAYRACGVARAAVLRPWPLPKHYIGMPVGCRGGRLEPPAIVEVRPDERRRGTRSRPPPRSPTRLTRSASRRSSSSSTWSSSSRSPRSRI